MELGKRKELILAAIVEQYIKTGEPIGSKMLMNTLPISVSSATIRNEMSELVEAGLLEQPHTSAGRIPSQSGYRYYIDNLMNRCELSQDEKDAIKNELSKAAGDPDKLLSKAGELLADITNCASLATSPSDAEAVVKRIEILPVGTRLAMIVLMTNNGIIKNGICRLESEITSETIDLFYEISAKYFVGKPVSDISTALIQTLVASLGGMALSMSPLFVSLADVAAQAVKSEIHLQGEQNLLHHRELGDSIFDTLEFLDEDEKIVRALAQSKNPLSVLIGKENIFRQLENSSLIVARYNIQGHDGGALGIIGPTRLDYAKLIPNIEFLTKLVSKFLSDAFKD